MIIYLYVKQHSITGLKYFGRTISKDPFKYKGSGDYWKLHIKKHGINHIKTIEIWGFDDQKLCSEFALKFSIENDIINSNEWANLILEDGTTGLDRTFSKSSEESNIKRSKSMQGKCWWNNGRDQIRSITPPDWNWVRGRLKFKRKPPSEESKEKISESLKGNTPWNKGKKDIYSEETINKLSQSAKLRTRNKNPFYGKTHTEETKKKISDKAKIRLSN